MKNKLTNQLIIMTDEHTRKVLGCYGNSIVQTPNLDRLARIGTVFSNAYCNVPICVPSRASFATGQYAHSSVIGIMRLLTKANLNLGDTP